MRYIVIANIVVWVLQTPIPSLSSYMAFNPALILQGQVWRLISFLFIPNSSGFLAFISFYFYYTIGNILESKWGTGMFTIYFLTGVILTEIYGFLIYFIFRINFTVTAYYVYMSMFFSFAALFPDMQVLLFFFLPIKIKWLAYVDAALFLYGVISTPFPASLLPLIAVLNFVLFCGGDIAARIKRKRSFNSMKKEPVTINFKKESEKIRREQGSSLYEHRCSVCGRTEKEHPELEFRYCSRCAGYHCFCSDHINSHIHFTQ